jgi:hypothetical protein
MLANLLCKSCAKNAILRNCYERNCTLDNYEQKLGFRCHIEKLSW